MFGRQRERSRKARSDEELASVMQSIRDHNPDTSADSVLASIWGMSDPNARNQALGFHNAMNQPPVEHKTYKGADGFNYWLTGPQANQRVNPDVMQTPDAPTFGNLRLGDQVWTGVEGSDEWTERLGQNWTLTGDVPAPGTGPGSERYNLR